jgi:hypothetical protein
MLASTTVLPVSHAGGTANVDVACNAPDDQHTNSESTLLKFVRQYALHPEKASFSGLPFSWQLKDYEMNLQPVGRIPQALGNALMFKQLVDEEGGTKSDRILNRWRPNVRMEISKEVERPVNHFKWLGCWVVPSTVSEQCSSCINQHMKALARLCEETFKLDMHIDSESMHSI